MRYNFPHFTPQPEFIQPDYNQWVAIQTGMSRDDVVARLGPPLDDDYRGGKSRPNDPYYLYGYLQMPMVPHPRTYTFMIAFDGDGTVISKIDPFNERFSTDGSPTSPEIIIPSDHALFAHYPRIVDCRWFPCSGIYPMTYVIEFGWAEESRPDQFHDDQIESELPIPFFMTTFSGKQPGRFRVKARNSVGDSSWSEYRYFSFTR